MKKVGTKKISILIMIMLITAVSVSTNAATLTVTNTNDNFAVGSLRWAVFFANDGDVIEFDAVVFATPKTIVLTNGQLEISVDLTINGPGADLLTISGNNASRVFVVSGPNINDPIDVEINNLTIADGDPPGGDSFGESGGGIILNGDNLTLDGVVVSDNFAGSSGGGIRAQGGTLVLTNSKIVNNDSGSCGGGINMHGTLIVEDSTISGNHAEASGGGVCAGGVPDQPTVIITHSTISGNLADGDGGGGIVLGDGESWITNSTISGNTGNLGAGILNTIESTLNLINSTIVFNGGGGLQDYGTSEVRNTIIAGNTFTYANPQPKDVSSPIETASNNLIGDTATAGGLTDGVNGNIVGVNVGLVLDTQLDDNGGPTLTHKLVPGSPAINAGDDNFAVEFDGAPMTSDQRGPAFPRFLGTNVDIGAFEIIPVGIQPTSTVLEPPATTQYSDLATLSATVTANGSPVTSGTVEFFVNGNSVGTDDVDSNGEAILSTQILLAAGSYSVSATYQSNDSYETSSDSSTLNVTKEEATVTASVNNAIAVKVNTPGGNAGPITLCASIADAQDGSLGDISLAVPVTFAMVPVAPGSTLQQQDASLSGGQACVTFNSVPVNVYDVTITVGGDYYTGTCSTVLAAYDPSLGFTTGGGRVINPTTGNILHFGFSFKYDKKGFKGQMILMEHTANGEVKLKSNSLTSLSIVGNQAIVLGKANITDGAGNLNFRLNVLDNGEPGSSDKFGLKVTAANGSVINAFTIDPPVTIAGGNIQVPQGAKK